jgi:BirA family biotin operon repressor/biotin-[acetyl-CoA-carboxylase] ligase
LLAEGRKVGGVLVETAGARGAIAWAVIGVGINANLARDALPAELRASAASLAEEGGREVSLDALLAELCADMQRALDHIESGAADKIMAAWRAMDTTPGRAVASARGEPIGIAQGIDSLGRLAIRGARGDALVLASTRGVIIE